MNFIKSMLEESAKRKKILATGNAVASTINAISNYKEKNPKKVVIRLPFESEYFLERKADEVQEELTAYGFKNIALLPKRDLKRSWLISNNRRDGTVEEISINGVTQFKKRAKFEENDRVVITYHTYKEQ